jgi:sulfatase modifying factor 1
MRMPSPTLRALSLAVTVVAVALLGPFSEARAVENAWVEVGDAGNEPAFNGYGAVDYVYLIGATEVTNAQYAEFLNVVDPSGANALGLYNADMTSNGRGGIVFIPGNAAGFKYQPRATFGARPVNYVSWYDAARFANWMHNGQGAGGTETGSYDMSLTTPIRLAEASVSLPSDDEWFKAAYYAPGKPYWLYPTRFDTEPTTAVLDDIDGTITNPGPNVANWDSDDTVSVVATAGNTSHYGTFDQAGNVSEWTEGIYTTYRGAKGGNWTGESIRADSFNSVATPTDEGSTRGFRLTAVPEPSRYLLSITAIATLWSLRRRLRV